MVGVLDTWYTSALHGNMWNRLYTDAIQRNRQLARSSLPSVQCVVCGRTFRREQDRARHKCIEEQSKPVHQQQGALQCYTCRKWFGSRGGLAVHSCQLSTEAVSVHNEVHNSVSTVDNRVYCAVCERTFSRIGDLKRHSRKISANRGTAGSHSMSGLSSMVSQQGRLCCTQVFSC